MLGLMKGWSDLQFTSSRLGQFFFFLRLDAGLDFDFHELLSPEIEDSAAEGHRAKIPFFIFKPGQAFDVIIASGGLSEGRQELGFETTFAAELLEAHFS